MALLADLDSSCSVPELPGLVSGPGVRLGEAVKDRRRRFFASMDDDFNAGAAIGELFGLIRDLNLYLVRTGGRALDRQPLLDGCDLLAEADDILGIFAPDKALLDVAAARAPAEVIALCQRRRDARLCGDWAEADALRGRIEAMGWALCDTGADYRLFRAHDRV
jgi:cysteinyl-tRNA synthetase